MPTPAERKALLFLAGVIVLGGSVRVVRAARDDTHDDPASRAALARQLAAVDSAHGAESAARKARPRKGRAARQPSASTRDVSPTASTLALSSTGPPPTTVPAEPIDLDVASAKAIETLPRIGPVLAQRIVEDRNANGPFGSMEEFQRVRGVGPALSRQLEGRVTFSGTARPSNAVASSRLSTPSPASKPGRRERRN